MSTKFEIENNDMRLRGEYSIREESDGSVPHADADGRYAVLSHTEGKNHHLTRAATPADARKVAAQCVKDGEWVEGVFDLAELDGDEPPIDQGDIVLHNGERYVVLLSPDTDGMVDLIDEMDWDEDHENQRADVVVPVRRTTLLERSSTYEEERDVKFYPVADVTLVVTFNKIIEE